MRALRNGNSREIIRVESEGLKSLRQLLGSPLFFLERFEGLLGMPLFFIGPPTFFIGPQAFLIGPKTFLIGPPTFFIGPKTFLVRPEPMFPLVIELQLAAWGPCMSGLHANLESLDALNLYGLAGRELFFRILAIFVSMPNEGAVVVIVGKD